MHSWFFSYFSGYSFWLSPLQTYLILPAIKYQGSPGIGPSTSFLLTLWFLYTLDSNLHQCTDESQSYISTPDLYSKLHTYITNCSLDIISCIYISLTPQLNMPQSELSPNWVLFQYPLSEWHHHTLQCASQNSLPLSSSFSFICYSQLIILPHGSYLLNISWFHLFLHHYHLSLCPSHHQSLT